MQPKMIIRIVTMCLRILSVLLAFLSFTLYVHTDYHHDENFGSIYAGAAANLHPTANQPLPGMSSSSALGVTSFAVRFAYALSVLGAMSISIILTVNQIVGGEKGKEKDALFHGIGCIVLIFTTSIFVTLMIGDEPVAENTGTVADNYSYWFHKRMFSAAGGLLCALLYGIISLILIVYYRNIEVNLDVNEMKSKFSMRPIHES